jgi:uracil-DNA glycosylase family 4
VTTDDIYQRYLDKAITEINRLHHEIVEAADGGFAAQPTGHPLADIFLLKYGAQTSELREGLAFRGRSGDAIIKSLRRLGVDASEIYGTNCVKFAGCDLGLAADWLSRELRIVEPKLIVVMGADAVEFVNGLAFPLSRTLAGTVGVLEQFTPTIEALTVPDIDSSLDEATTKTAFWNAFKPVGPWWAALPPY